MVKNMIHIYCDGGCIVGRNIGARSYVIVKDGKIIKMAGSAINSSGLTNNQAEYDAIIHALCICGGAEKVIITSDSEVVIKQINGEYKVRDEKLFRKHALVKALIKSQDIFEFVNVPRTNHYIRIADSMNKMLMEEALK